LVENTATKFNEPERQQMLLAEARRIPGPRLVVALDADEFLTANFLTSLEWETILNAPTGTVISCQWPYVQTNVGQFSYFQFPNELTIGYVDDGAEHQGHVIHSQRVPAPPNARRLQLKEIKVMHYCLMDPERVASRLRWYQCWEYLNNRKRPIDLYRFYYTLFAVPSGMVKPVPTEWIQGYEQTGIDMTSVNREGNYRWDREVIQFFEEHGTTRFRRLAIWDANWSKLHDELCPDKPKKHHPDPRNGFDKLVQRWLRWTQRYYCFHESPGLAQRLHHSLVEKALRPFGW
jgi:hypothetical protein